MPRSVKKGAWIDKGIQKAVERIRSGGQRPQVIRTWSRRSTITPDMVGGKNVNQALAILRYSNKRAALGIEKCVRSAIANANETAEKANVSVDPDELWLKAAYVDRGPTKNRRRVRAAPQGRAYREQRHFCHVTILLSSDHPGEETRTEAATPAASTKAKRGGAAAAPRARRAGSKKEAAQSSETRTAGSKPEAKREKKAS